MECLRGQEGQKRKEGEILIPSFFQSILAYLESAQYLVVALVIILIYIILREGLKRAGEKHGAIAVAITAIVFGLLLYLHLFLYAVLDFLLLVLVAYFQIRADMIRAAREERGTSGSKQLGRRFGTRQRGR